MNRFSCKYKIGILSVVIGLCSVGSIQAEEQQPMKSWLNFFTYADRWDKKPQADIFGVVQPTYSNVQDSPTNNNLNFNRARFGLRGTVTEDVSFWSLFEFANNGVTAPVNGAARLLDAQVNWHFMKDANLRMGLFIPDFALAITPGALVPWIDYTDIEKSVTFFNRQGDTQTTALREQGASIWNEYRWDNSAFNYEVGVYNGNGLNQGDNDKKKNVIASARYAVGPWWLHSGYMTGERLVSGENLNQQKVSATAGWGDYPNGKYWVLAEYLESKQEQPGNVADVKDDGFYVAGGYKVTDKDLLVYRFSRCDCGENVGPPGARDSDVHTFTYSHFIKGQTKIVAQYDLRSDSLNTDSNAFRVYFSLPFSYRI